MGAWLNFLWRFGWGLALSLLILSALLNLAARIAMTQLDRFKPELSLLFEDAGLRGLELERMSGDWRGWRPRFHFEGVRLRLPGRNSPSVAISRLDLTVKPFRSLVEGRFQLADVRARIDQLKLERRQDGGWDFNRKPLAAGSGTLSFDLQRFLQQLPDHLSLRVASIQLVETADSSLEIRDLNLQSRRWRGGRQLWLQAELPPELGQDLVLLLNGDWQEQRLYLESTDLNLKRLQELLPWRLEVLHSVRVDLRSWMDFDAFRLVRVQSLAQMRDLRLEVNSRIGEPLQFGLRQLLQRDEQGWRNDLRIHSLRQGRRHLPPVSSQQLWQPDNRNLQVWINELDLNAVADLFRPFLGNLQARQLATWYPQGLARDLLLDYRVDAPLDSRWYLRLHRASAQVVGRVPGVRNLSLTIRGRGYDGLGRIDSEDLWLDFGDLFRDPLHASRLSANLQFSWSQDRLLLDSPDFRLNNADAALAGRLRLEVEPGERPFVSLRASASHAEASATGRYLPTRIMPPATVSWLDDAIRGGEVKRAELLFHGRSRSLKSLDAAQSGELTAWLDIRNPLLRYRPGWPAVTRGQGSLEFHNLSMSANFRRVDFGKAEAREVRVEIPNLANARLYLSARGRNDAAKLLDSLSAVRELPLFQRLREPTESIGGEVDLQLTLELPLSRRRQSPMSLTTDLKFRGLNWQAPDWLVDVTDLRGELKLAGQRLTGKKLKARYDGSDINIGIDGDLGAGRTDIVIDGELPSRNLLGLLPPIFGAAIEGRSPWKLRLALHHARKERGLLMDIEADSELLGTALTLPEPLALSAEEPQKVHFNARLTPKQYLDFRLDMGPRLRLEGRYDGIAEGAGLERIDYLNLVIGNGELPQGDAGLRLRAVAGNLDVDAWQNWFRDNGSGLDLNGEGLLSRVLQLDLDVGELHWNRRSLTDLKLALVRQGTYLGGSLSSSVASGSMLWPVRSGPQTPMVFDLDFLSWPDGEGRMSGDWEPRIEDMPSLVLVSKEFRWRQMTFSDLVLRTVNDGRRFEVQRLDLRKDQVVLRATGHWQSEGLGGDDITVFNVSIKGQNFGQAVQHLGLGETLNGGTIDFFGQIGWGGAIDQINWDTLIGEVDLTLENGYLRNVDPGAGRFVGLLSFSALPRRLYLDFGDVLRNGLEFSKMRGKFSIKGEILSTDDAWMDSPSAEVRIKGITNLRTKTYNQTMYIVPKVGDTLPVIGAIAGGSSLGWGILLLQKIFKKPIDKSVEIEYRVTGPWDNPKIDLVEKPKDKQETHDEQPFEGHPNP